MRIAILAVDAMFDSGLAVTLDVLATANALRGEAAATTPPFEVTVTAIRNEVRTGHALHLATTPLAELPAPPDLLVMPAVGLRAPAEVIEIVRGHPALPHVAALHRGGHRPRGRMQRDVLPGRGRRPGRPGGHHELVAGPAFRGRYGAVQLRDSAVLVGDERITTAGAAFAHIDLALSVVQRQSPALAELTARYLLIGDRPSQAVFAVPSLLARSDPTVTAFERWVREHVAEPVQISRAAAAIGVSERTLQRTMAAVLGMSPIDFVHEIRLDQATFLLRTTGLTADAVAAAVGYQNTSTLRALVRRRRGSTISALRR